MLQRCKPCQEKAVEQTFVVDCKRLLSFAVGYIADYHNILLFRFVTRILKDILQILPLHQFLECGFIV